MAGVCDKDYLFDLKMLEAIDYRRICWQKETSKRKDTEIYG